MSNIDLGSKPKAGGIKPNEQQKIQIARAIQGFKSPSFFGPIAEYAPLGFDIISDATGQGFAAYVINKSSIASLDLSNANASGMINLENCTALYDLICFYNGLTSLDVTGCTSLTTLSCQSNALTSLDVSGCTSLYDLSCQNNQLTSLDVTGCTALNTLSCGYSGLTSLDVSGCTSLYNLYCNYNALTSFAIDNIIIDLNTNGITTGYLNLSGGTSAAPSAASAAALANLTAPQPGGLGWVVITN